jgi:mannose-6-phosphate isomerase-like protein (cupin superfamily)
MNEQSSAPINSGKFDLSKGPWISEPENFLQYKKLIFGERDGSDLSLTFIEIKGEHKELLTKASSRIYLIHSGDFTFQISNLSEFSVTAGDAVYIKRGDPYRFTGNGTYFVINGPAFKDGDDIY